LKRTRFVFPALLTVILVCLSRPSCGQEPVTPHASAEAKALLRFIYSLSGKYTLTGQHNYPNTGDRNSQFAAEYSGKIPAVWSTDMGFAEDGDTDSYLARPDIVQEAIRQHRKGSVITICWHAVPPTADEPVTFRPSGPFPPDSLASIQGRLPDEQFREVLTPGTRLHGRWMAQVDSVARYLKMLDEADVPVLWRPYHEMNGDWFWWGKKGGEDGYMRLWQIMFDRFVNFHGLTNLIWVYNTNEFKDGVDPHDTYYPGDQYVDILATDVYSEGFNQVNYDQMLELAGDKPIALGEVGNPPPADKLKEQPRWTWFMRWGDPGGFGRGGDPRELFNSEQVITHDELPWVEVKDPILHYPVLK
jgi:mannan endo-1,4-beta-mannosidase